MRLRNVFGMLLSLFVLVIVGCGGGGNDTPAGPTGTAVSGSAVKGPITGGTVQAFEIISSASTPRTNIPRFGTTVLATGTTAADGSFTLVIPPALKKGGVLFKLTGGTYKDEATGLTRNVNDQAAGGIHAVFGNISGIARRGDTLTVNLTPFTELGFQTLGTAAPTDAAIAAANARVVTTFGLTGIDILKTKPFDATTAPPTGVTQAQRDYSLALAVLSQSQEDSTPDLTLDQLNALLLPDVNAGLLSPANSAAGSIALLNFLNSGTNLSGGTVVPVTVAVTPASAATATVGTNVTIAATVQQPAGTNVPNGTEVKFAIKSSVIGVGTLSAATATTTAGVASVTLSSPTDTAAFVVTATAGGVAADTALITFVDINKPTTVTLAASPTSGVTNNNVPVTLTATVAPGAGGTIAVGTPVTFTILTGTGTLSSATANTTASGVNGVASVTLNSTAVGTVTVNATAGSAVVTSNTVSVPFIAQPTQAIVTVSLTGTLPTTARANGSFQRIGAATANIAYSTTDGLGLPVSVKLGIGNTANIFATNLTLNPTQTGASWADTIPPDVVPTVGSIPGILQTLTFPITAGNFPVAGDFTVAGTSTVLDDQGVSLAGTISITISVQIQ